MAALSYRRFDHVVSVTVEPPQRRARLSRLVVTAPGYGQWSTRASDVHGLHLGGLTRALHPIRPLHMQSEVVERVVVETPPEWADASWESALAKWAGGRLIVRASTVPPPYVERPLALPLRIAQVTLPSGPRADHGLATFLDQISYRARQQYAVDPVETMSTASTRLNVNLRRREWPTVDVMQLDGPLPRAELLDPDAEKPGSLGWIERLAGLYQIRLLVLPAADPRALSSTRTLAAHLLERGGPAVLIAPPDAPRIPFWEPSLRQIYAALVHDEPLDIAIRSVPDALLFAGAGREDAVRVSAAIQVVVERARKRPIDLSHLVAREPLAELQPHQLIRIERDVDTLAARWEEFDYTGEGRGLYPSAKAIEPLTRLLKPVAHRYRRRPKPQTEAEARFVNATLHQSGQFGPTTEVAQAGPPLVRGELYHLRVDVGPLAAHVRPAGALELLVEDQLWDAHDGGLWTELAVSGIGCTVLGSPVQPLLVPRCGPSNPRYIPIEMGTEPTAVLRYSLYYRTHLVQSFRLVAILADGRGRVTPSQRRELADLLSVARDEVRERVWYSRLEFSTVARVEEAAELPERTLTVVANDAGGQPLITVKARGSFEVSIPTDIDNDVKAARGVLNDVSGADHNAYRFGYDGDANATDDAFYATVLGQLAAAGWSLRTRVFPAGAEEAIDRLLAKPGATIQIAHILRDKVVPWALVYDKRYDANRRRLRGRKVDHVACTASLPNKEGELAVTTCGTDPACPLHPDRLAERDSKGEPAVLPETVACPLGFWGIRHQIELPPGQVAPQGEPLPAVRTIAAPKAARVLLAFNAKLESTAEHRCALEAALAKARRGGPPAYLVTDRDDVIDALADGDLDVVYLYCHAVGGEPGPVPPRLEFQELTDPAPIPITPPELPPVTWAHNPLVVLNGCGTTGFSSHGTSEFIRELVDRRHAAAVIGADVPVAEALASEIGTALIRAVLDEVTLGEALARARRTLLAKRNPLGLAYALYGSVDLALH